MTDDGAGAALVGGITLLERAISYTLGSLWLVTPELLSCPTPCRGWDLRALLRHLNDSIAVIREAADLGRLDLRAPVPDSAPAVDLVATLRRAAGELLGTWTSTAGRGRISIAGQPLTAGLVASTAAIELTVHGWDVAGACGRPRPIPPALAEELLELAPLLVTGADRPGRFATPVPVPPGAGPGDRLIAFLGRHPYPVNP